MSKIENNEAFVRAYQAARGLPVDGWAGPATRADLAKLSPTAAVSLSTNTITERAALELVAHEAIVPEAYRDSVGVWTWGVGVTDASGHAVMRYKDNPQSIADCLKVYVWLLREKYAPAVVAAFKGHPLTENQFAAALSFHYNTGAIGRATWVKSFLAGDTVTARAQFLEWKKPAEIIERRKKEAALFFDGVWSANGMATVYPVRKPSYSPDWKLAKRVDIRAAMKEAMG